MRIPKPKTIGISIIGLFCLAVGMAPMVSAVQMEWQISEEVIQQNQKWLALNEQAIEDAHKIIAEEKRRRESNLYHVGKLDGLGYVYNWETNKIENLFPR